MIKVTEQKHPLTSLAALSSKLSPPNHRSAMPSRVRLSVSVGPGTATYDGLDEADQLGRTKLLLAPRICGALRCPVAMYFPILEVFQASVDKSSVQIRLLPHEEGQLVKWQTLG